MAADLTYTKCPVCMFGHLEKIGEKTEGFSCGKAALGAMIVGPIGLAAGALGKKKTTYRCTNCTYTTEK